MDTLSTLACQRPSPRFVGPYKILMRVGEVVYELALPLRLSYVHPIFHVSMPHQYILEESHVIYYDFVELVIDWSSVEEPIAILDKWV